MSKTLKFILQYLKDKDWTSPTEIGRAYCHGYHSSWASPKCKRLVEMGYLERNNNGHYRLLNENK